MGMQGCLKWFRKFLNKRKTWTVPEVDHVFHMFAIDSASTRENILHCLEADGFHFQGSGDYHMWEFWRIHTAKDDLLLQKQVQDFLANNSSQSAYYQQRMERYVLSEEDPYWWDRPMEKWKMTRNDLLTKFPALKELIVHADLYRERYEMNQIQFLLNAANLGVCGAKEALTENYLYIAIQKGYQFAEELGYSVEDCILEACTLLAEHFDVDYLTKNLGKSLEEKLLIEGLYKSYPPESLSCGLDDDMLNNRLKIDTCLTCRSISNDRLVNKKLKGLDLSTDQIDDLKRFVPLSYDEPLSAAKLAAIFHLNDRQCAHYIEAHISKTDDYEYESSNYQFDIINTYADLQSLDTYQTYFDYLLFAYDILTEDEMQLLIMRYGLFSTRPHTYEECGRYFGFTRERIRQKITSIQDKLSNEILHMTYFEEMSDSALSYSRLGLVQLYLNGQDIKQNRTPEPIEIEERGEELLGSFYSSFKKYDSLCVHLSLSFRIIYTLWVAPRSLTFEQFVNKDEYFAISRHAYEIVNQLNDLIYMGLICVARGRVFLSAEAKQLIEQHQRNAQITTYELQQNIHSTRRSKGRSLKKKRKNKQNNLDRASAKWTQNLVEQKIINYLKRQKTYRSEDEIIELPALRGADEKLIESALQSLVKKKQLNSNQVVKIVCNEKTNWSVTRTTAWVYQFNNE